MIVEELMCFHGNPYSNRVCGFTTVDTVRGIITAVQREV